MNDQQAAAYPPIGHYALLSDCGSSALVSRAGSVDWACFRRFDAGTAFARLLDADRGGFFSVRPVGEITVERRYLPQTMVLETTMTTARGTLVLTDAFDVTVGEPSIPQAELMRQGRCSSGEVEVEVILEPRFDYGACRPWFRHHPDDDRWSVVGGDDAMVVGSTISLSRDEARHHLLGQCHLAEGEGFAMSVVSQPSFHLDLDRADADGIADRMAESTTWWREWSERTETDGEHADLIERSALVLKALTCDPSGAIIAAPTTSLPEVPGGSANWDYRYSWIRDSTLALDALTAVGHDEAARGFRNFILRSSAGHPDELQVLYGSHGARRVPEAELDLAGWRGAAPVRVGNGAANQLQLDVYGHLLDAAHQWKAATGELDDDEWRFLAQVVDRATETWHQRDAGIWELRGQPRHFVHSKVMVWVALDRGISLGESRDLDEDTLERWRSHRADVRAWVDEHGVDPDRGCFVQHDGTAEVDASLLKLGLVGFVDAGEERMRATVTAIREDLGVPPGGLLRRFRPGEGAEAEGAFLVCSCWLVAVLARQGNTDEAGELLDRLAAVGNDLDLFSEQYNVEEGQLLGNFPQAFTHLGLISAQRELARARQDGGG